MSFASREESRYSGEPIELYQFVYGELTDNFFAYTNGEQPVTVGEGDEARIFQPIPITRTAINASGTLDRSNLTVTVPKDNAAAGLYKFYPPSSVTTLVIWQGHVGDPEFLVIWAGRVLSVAWEENTAALTCQPISTALRRNGLRRNYQYGCPLVLYGPQCRANKEAATTSAVVDQVNGPLVTLSGWTSETPLEKYQNGLIEWVDPNGIREVRNVLRITQDGSVAVVMGGRSRGLQAGATVNLVLGCNHNGDDCELLHHNIKNYGGQPWIPLENPIGIKNVFY